MGLTVKFHAAGSWSLPVATKPYITAITPLKVIQGHRFWCQSKARMRLPISEYYKLTSCLVPFSSYCGLAYWSHFRFRQGGTMFELSQSAGS